MKSLLQKLFNQTLYIQIHSNQFTLLDVDSGRQQSIQSPKPFSNQRLAIADFSEADKTLRAYVKEFYDEKLFKPSPIVVMHQRVKTEGGLSEVEERILKELGLSAGGRQVYVWQGEELSLQQLRDKKYL